MKGSTEVTLNFFTATYLKLIDIRLRGLKVAGSTTFKYIGEVIYIFNYPYIGRVEKQRYLIPFLGKTHGALGIQQVAAQQTWCYRLLPFSDLAHFLTRFIKHRGVFFKNALSISFFNGRGSHD